MNAPIKFEFSLLHAGVMLALASMMVSPPVSAACSDNGAGTITCSGTTGNTNTDAALVGNVVLDNASGAVQLDNTGTDPTIIIIPDTGNGPTLGAVITNASNTVETANTITVNGNNPVLINNLGALINMDGTLRIFDPAGWSNDSNGLLLNGGLAVGMASAISAGPLVQSLTINNQSVNNGVFYPDPYFINGVPAYIKANGEYSAAIFTNTPLFTLSGTGAVIGRIATFGGADYTAPAVVDGTQYATLNSAGLTTIDFSSGGVIGGSLEIVDRNPLLTDAQALNPGLVLAYSTNDVGPRNSIINLGGQLASIGGNVYLGSGAHTINMTGATISGNIYVDQRDSDVVSVTGGVATTLFKVHGDRTFTLNYDGEGGSSDSVGLGDIVINDVVGSVNNVNIKFNATDYFPNNFTANGVGSNTLSLTYRGELGQADGLSNAGTRHSGSILGFNTLNLSGGSINLMGQYNILGDVNINSGYVILPGDYFGITTNLVANNVVVNQSASLITSTILYGVNNKIGDITGNLVNNGTIFVGDATLDVNGNVSLNAGSILRVDAGPLTMGKINATGTTTIASDAVIVPRVKQDIVVHKGDSYVIATNASNVPTIDNQKGLLQWVPDISTGNLTLTADIRLPNSLKSQITQAGSNAVDAFFSVTGSKTDVNDNISNLQLRLMLPDISDKNLERAAERLRPEVNDGSIRMLLGNSDNLFNVIDAHLLDAVSAKAQDATVEAELDGKPAIANKGLWVQGFGNRGSQEERNGVDGYGLSSVGIAMGMDKVLDFSDYTRAGLAFGYARSNTTNSGNTVNNRIDMNSFMAAAYASRAWDDVYINGIFGFGRHTYATRRQLFEHTATGTHDSWQFSGKLDAGWPIELNESFIFTPMTSLNYSHIKESGYQENGVFNKPLYDESVAPNYPLVINGIPQFALINSPINLQVEGRTFNSLRAGIGGKGVYTIQEPDWSAELELHGMLNHEFGDLAQNSNARFVAGGNAFNSPSVQPARDSLIIGGKVNLTSIDENDQLSLITSYDAEIRSKYFGQIVSLAARYDFDQAPRYLKIANARNVALGKQVATQSIQATEKDIAAIQQALQSGTDDENDPNRFENTEKLVAINQTLSTWIAALSNKNLDAYFNSYAASFSPNDGSTRQQWERKRKSEITRDANPNVKVSYMTIKPHGNHAIAVFTQKTTVGKTQDLVQKIVDLENKNGRWLILREDSIALAE